MDFDELILKYKPIIKQSKEINEIAYYHPSLEVMDVALNGIPLKQMIIISGPTSIGKTSLAATLASGFKYNLYIDADHKVDGRYLNEISASVNPIYVMQNNYIEDILPVIVDILDNWKSCIVIDSFPMLISKSFIDNSTLQNSFNLINTRLVNEFIKKIAAYIYKHQSLIIIINQIRKDTATGGIAIPGGSFLFDRSAQHIYMVKQRNITDGLSRIGHDILCKVIFNKYNNCTDFPLTLYYGKGFDHDKAHTDASKLKQLMEK